MNADALLAELPATFRYTEAIKTIGERQLRNLIAAGKVVALARGLYRKHDWNGDEDLIEIAAKTKTATICLRSALARHDLIDDIPDVIDIAIPRNTWKPTLRPPIRWHHFDTDTFSLGRDSINIGAGRSIGLYSAERSIIDAYRLRHREGEDMANTALKRWLKSGGQPTTLIKLAQAFPRTLTALKTTLEILL